MKYISHSIEDTFKIAEKFAKTLNDKAIILLFGDLGAGKTHFVKGVAKALKSKNVVTSPTFTIMNLYEGKTPIYHFDMYRLSEDEAMNMGLEEYFDLDSLKGITIVEWPENAGKLITSSTHKIYINKLSGDLDREILILEEKC